MQCVYSAQKTMGRPRKRRREGGGGVEVGVGGEGGTEVQVGLDTEMDMSLALAETSRNGRGGSLDGHDGGLNGFAMHGHDQGFSGFGVSSGTGFMDEVFVQAQAQIEPALGGVGIYGPELSMDGFG